MVEHIEWAQSEFPDFAKSRGDYLSGIVDEAENNVQPITGLVMAAVVGVLLSWINSFLAQQPVLGATETPMWLVLPAFYLAILSSGPLSKVWVRRSIRRRVAAAMNTRNSE